MCLSGTRPDGTIALRSGTTGRADRDVEDAQSVTETRTATRGGRRGTLRVLAAAALATWSLHRRALPHADRRRSRCWPPAPVCSIWRSCCRRPANMAPVSSANSPHVAATPVRRVHAVHLWQELHPLLSPYTRRAREGRALFARAIDGAAELGAKVNRLAWTEASRDAHPGRAGRTSSMPPPTWRRLRRRRTAPRDRERLLVRAGHGARCAGLLREREGVRPPRGAGRLRLRSVPGRRGRREPVHDAGGDGRSRLRRPPQRPPRGRPRDTVISLLAKAISPGRPCCAPSPAPIPVR